MLEVAHSQSLRVVSLALRLLGPRRDPNQLPVPGVKGDLEASGYLLRVYGSRACAALPRPAIGGGWRRPLSSGPPPRARAYHTATASWIYMKVIRKN